MGTSGISITPNQLVLSESLRTRTKLTVAVHDSQGNRNNSVTVSSPVPAHDNVNSPMTSGPADLFTAMPTFDDLDDTADEHMPPLLSHESFTASELTLLDDEDPALLEDADTDEIWDDKNEHGAPLLRHEVHHDAYDEAPLFRHESIFQNDVVDKHVHAEPMHRRHSDSAIEQFPTTASEIISHLSRVASRLPADEAIVHGTPPTSPEIHGSVRRTSFGSQASATNLNSAQLDSISESDEEDLSQNTQAKSQHQRTQSTSTNIPAGVLTPPMTPEIGNDIDNVVRIGPITVVEVIDELTTSAVEGNDKLSGPMKDDAPGPRARLDALASTTLRLL